MPRKSKVELLADQAQRLFAQRVYFVTHASFFILALVLTRGRIARLGIVFAVWAVVFILHGAYYALYENREASLRRIYKNMDGEARTQNNLELEDDSDYYTVGEDGELIPLDEADADEANH